MTEIRVTKKVGFLIDMGISPWHVQLTHGNNSSVLNEVLKRKTKQKRTTNYVKTVYRWMEG